MNQVLNWAGQALLYSGFAIAIGVFSRWPVYHPLEPGMAQIKISFMHQGQRLADCHTYTAEELAKLPPNMRKATVCERERSPVSISVDIDGRQVLDHVSPPSGISRDGSSTLYKRIDIPAGEHQISVRFNDDQKVDGYTHQLDETITLQPSQVMVVDFNQSKGGIVLQ